MHSCPWIRYKSKWWKPKRAALFAHFPVALFSLAHFAVAHFPVAHLERSKHTRALDECLPNANWPARHRGPFASFFFQFLRQTFTFSISHFSIPVPQTPFAFPAPEGCLFLCCLCCQTSKEEDFSLAKKILHFFPFFAPATSGISLGPNEQSRGRPKTISCGRVGNLLIGRRPQSVAGAAAHRETVAASSAPTSTSWTLGDIGPHWQKAERADNERPTDSLWRNQSNWSPFAACSLATVSLLCALCFVLCAPQTVLSAASAPRTVYRPLDTLRWPPGN